MFCSNCGKEVKEGMSFCPACGRTLHEEGEKGCGIQTGGREKPKRAKKRFPWALIAAIAVLALILAVLIALFILRQQPEQAGGKGQEEWAALEVQDGNMKSEAEEITSKEAAAETAGNPDESDGGSKIQEATEPDDASENSDDALKSAFVCNSEASGDYSLNLDYSSFAYYQSSQNAAFHFSYPTNLYNSVTVSQAPDSTEFGTNLENIFFTAADGASSARFQLGRRNEAVSIQESTQQLYQLYEQTLTDLVKITYNDDSVDHGRFVATGYADASRQIMVYLVVAVYQDSVQIMQITFFSDGNLESEEFMQKSYIVECMYRMCGFGNSSYKPRTYQQYLAGEQGEKYQ